MKIVDACGVTYQIENTQAAKDSFIREMNQYRQADGPNFRLEEGNGPDQFFLFNEATDVIIKVRLFSVSSISRKFIIRKNSTVEYLTRLCGCVSWVWPKNVLLNERFAAKIIGLDYEITEDMNIQDLVDANVHLFASTVSDSLCFTVRIKYGSKFKVARINVGQTLRVSDLVDGYAVIWDGQELSANQRLETLDMSPEKGPVEIVESRRNRAPKRIMKTMSNPIEVFFRYANKVLAEQNEMLDAIAYYSQKI